jgi:4'-phosphopantetheinyl transferase
LWGAAPRHHLARGGLHVWSADLDAVDARRASVLSSEEIERAQQISRDEARQRWMAARAFLRTILGAYAGSDPGSLRFVLEEHGKPALATNGDAGLRFSLSHSGPVAVCALTRMCAVGVDVQLPPRRLNARGVALRAFGAQRAQRLWALPPAERERGLLRAWVGLEAERKRVGLGMGRLSERLSGPQAWLHQLDLGAGATGAVALALPPSELRCGTWHG